MIVGFYILPLVPFFLLTSPYSAPVPRIPKETISSADAGWRVVPGLNKNKVLDLKTSINSVGEAIPGAKEYHHLGVVPDVTDKVLEMAYEAQSEINKEFIPFCTYFTMPWT